MQALRSFALGLALCLSSLSSVWAETRLVMAEEDGCYWCERWNKEISAIYPKTAEGRAAPLLRLDIHDPLPDGLRFERPLIYTPTFVLMVDGVEAARIEGYPGEDFFWGLLAQLLKDARIEPSPAG